mmetsp:Transcript_29980/g.95698  ORF Transcript_29980/g.95698 Transcript_29980/m.95698 type:complete len:413 (-) Transcript_29980:1648-2886(-)
MSAPARCARAPLRRHGKRGIPSDAGLLGKAAACHGPGGQPEGNLPLASRLPPETSVLVRNGTWCSLGQRTALLAAVCRALQWRASVAQALAACTHDLLPLCAQSAVRQLPDIPADGLQQQADLLWLCNLQGALHDIVAVVAVDEHGHPLALDQFRDEACPELWRRRAEELLHDVRRELLYAQLHHAALQAPEDRGAADSPPLLKRVLYGVVPVGALHQVQGVQRKLRKQQLLVLTRSSRLRYALLQYAEPVGMVGHFHKLADHRVVDPICTRRQKAIQQSLDDMCAVGVHAKLDHVVLHSGHQKLLLLCGAQQPNQCLQSVGASLVAGNDGYPRGQLLEHALPLLHGAGLEGHAAEIVSIGIAHELRNVLLHFAQDDIHNAGMTLKELPLQVLAPRLRLGELRHLPTHLPGL